MYKQFLFLGFLLFLTTFYGQSADEVLVSINDHHYTVNDFERVYTKNLDLLKDENQKDLDNYMDLYILYQLKVQKAYELGLDKNKKYQQEFAKHRAELAEKYFTDESRLNELIKEAYERSDTEREASHILFRVDAYASPQDTLKAYQKAMEVYKKAQSGMDFGELAIEYSEDPSAKHNKGYLGYFTVFRMVYPFETAAFETPIGEVSKPIRSQFGYHLIKVTDEKSIRYYRSISLIRLHEADFVDPQLAEEAIHNVYSSIQQGQSMQEASTQFARGLKSDFRQIEKFYPGSLSVQELDEKVYNMNEGQYSEPFYDRGSWYIVQLDKILPFPTYEESYDNIRRRVISDARAQILQENLSRYLQEKYHLQPQNALQSVKDLYQNKVFNNDWETPELTKPETVVASYNGGEFTAEQFADFLNNRLKNKANFTLNEAYLNNEWEEFVSHNLKKTYDENLEEMFPEFKHTVQEYREGLLLFDLMEQEIWTKAKQDTVAQRNYFDQNLKKYATPAKIVGALLVYDTKEQADNALKLYKKNRSYEKTVGKQQPETWYKGEISETDERLRNSQNLRENSLQVFPMKTKFAFLAIETYVPAKPAELDEVKNQVAHDYQNLYEEQWNNNLKQNTKIVINQSAFEQLKKKYQ